MKYIRLNENNKVIAIRFGNLIVDGEVESENGNVGQIMQEDGTFIDDTTIVPQPYNPTNTEIAQMISDLQADLIIKGAI